MQLFRPKGRVEWDGYERISGRLEGMVEGEPPCKKIQMRLATPEEVGYIKDAVSKSRVSLGKSVFSTIIANRLGFNVPNKREDEYTEADRKVFEREVGRKAVDFSTLDLKNDLERQRKPSQRGATWQPKS